MDDWDFSPPPHSDLGDHDVELAGSHLAGKRVAVLVTGGIAAFKAPLVARALRKQGADVVAFASDEALRYVTAETLEWATVHPVVTRLTPAAEHLSDDAPFDAYLVAPATYNTINKLAAGIADTPVTAALASALGRLEQGAAKLLVVPTMHGSLHTSILTESLEKLSRLGVRVVPPREGYGKHNIPAEEVLVSEVCRELAGSLLKGRRVLVTGGPTPVPIDSVRRITNRFRGRLGTEITLELFLRGAEACLVHGDGAFRPPAYLPFRVARTYDEYVEAVMDELESEVDGRRIEAGIFSAAVADYRPKRVLPGKTPSGGALSSLELEPTEKVVDLVRDRFPHLYMVTFKYQEGISHDELMAIGRERLERQRGRGAVVANRGEETGPNGEQVAWLLSANGDGPDGGTVREERMEGKDVIAAALADHLEAVF